MYTFYYIELKAGIQGVLMNVKITLRWRARKTPPGEAAGEAFVLFGLDALQCVSFFHIHNPAAHRLGQSRRMRYK